MFIYSKTAGLLVCLVIGIGVWLLTADPCDKPAFASPPDGFRAVGTTAKVYSSTNPDRQIGMGTLRFSDMHASVHNGPDGKKHLYNWDFYVKGDYTINGVPQFHLIQHATTYMTAWKKGNTVTLNISVFTANVSGARIDPATIKLNATGVSDPPRDGELEPTAEEAKYIRRVMAKLDIGA